MRLASMSSLPLMSGLRNVTLILAGLFWLGCGSSEPTMTETPTISISISPMSATVEQGGSTTTDVTVTGGGGFTGTASIQVQDLPTGVTATVGSPSSSGGTTTATVTIDVGASAPAGSHDLTIRATGSGVSAVEQTFTLTVTAAPAFGLAASAASIMVEQETSGDVDLTLTRTNFTGDVTFAVEGAPSGMTTAFDTNPTSGDAATLTVTPDGTVAAGTYTLTVRATADGLPDQTVDVDVVVTEPGLSAIMLGAAPTTVELSAGGSADVTLSLTRSNFTDPVTLSTSTLPTGVTGSFADNPLAGDATTFTLSVDGSAALGDETVTITATGTGVADATVDVTLTVVEVPAYSLAVTPDPVAVPIDGSADATVALTRVNFAEPVDLSVEGAPSGVTASFSEDPATGASTTVTFAATSAVAAGSYDVTVRGTATGLADETTTVTLDVQPQFEIGSVTAVSLEAGASDMTTVPIDRAFGFTGDVTVTVTDLPTGITATVDPVTTDGNSTELTVNVGGSVTPGAYTGTVRGNATGQPESSVEFTINVTTGSGSDVTLDFGLCSVDDQPVWLAYKDGAGSWTEVGGVGGSFTFSVASTTAGVAWTVESGGGTQSTVVVQYATQGELVSGQFGSLCDAAAAGKTVGGSFTGLSLDETGNVTLGGITQPLATNGSVTWEDVPSGLVDLVGYKGSMAHAGDRMLIARGLDPAAGGSIGARDFTTDGFDPVSATITAPGPLAEVAALTMSYATTPSAGVCHVAPLWTEFTDFMDNDFVMYGAPGAEQEAGDQHVVTATAATTTSVATLTESTTALSSRTLSFGAVLPTPTITELTGPYRRIRSEVTMPAEYNGFASVFVSDVGGDRSIIVQATQAWLGGLSVSLEIPDLSSVSNWDATWGPTTAVNSDWGFSANGSTGSICTDGARQVSRTAIGTVG